MKTVLITGGTGTIGQALSARLTESGYSVRHLSRSSKGGKYPSFAWDLAKGTVDERAFEEVSSIIHLAGAGVADQRWTAGRKVELLSSRVDSSALLWQKVSQLGVKLDSFISASAIGSYGDSGSTLVNEESPYGTDFLAHVVKEWEKSVEPFSAVTRLVKIRIGIVLSSAGGALPTMAKPVRFGVGAPLGSGQQYMSWIHERDLVGAFQFALESDLSGTFNAVSPNPVTNKELTKAIGVALHRPILLPPVPDFVMKILLGEMAAMVLGGSRVSASKLLDAGFRFEFPELQPALNDLLK